MPRSHQINTQCCSWRVVTDVTSGAFQKGTLISKNRAKGLYRHPHHPILWLVAYKLPIMACMREKELFDHAVKVLGDEHDAIKRSELAELERRKRVARIRTVIASLLWMAFFVTAFYYHTELQQFITEKVLAPPKTHSLVARLTEDTNHSETAKSLSLIQAKAAERDELVAEFTRPRHGSGSQESDTEESADSVSQ